jgi:hypothetical protein
MIAVLLFLVAWAVLSVAVAVWVGTAFHRRSVFPI